MAISKLATIAATALGAQSAAAQIEWTRQSPYPADNDVQAVYFTSPDVGWISGADNILMGTTDGGVTWMQTPSVVRQPAGLEDDIWHIQFVDAQHGFAIGDRAYRTVNGGQTWVQQVQPIIGSVLDFEFLTTERGFAWNRRAVMATTNGGQSWTGVVPEDFSHFIYDIDFLNEDLALAVGRMDSLWGVFRSTNGGTNWQRISQQNLKFVLIMSQTEVIGANGPDFYRSTDGGATWTQTYSDFDPRSQADVEAIRRVDEDSVAAVAFDGRIWMSHDRGQTWARVKEPTGRWGSKWDIQFPKPQVGYAVGRIGLIYKTTDGGQTWTQLSNGGARTMNDLVMLPSGVGMAVGREGVVLRTTDFGKHWTASQLRATGHFSHDTMLHCVEAVDEDTFIVGGQTSLFRTDDAGASWTLLAELGGNADVFDTHFLDEQRGWAFGALDSPRGFIDRTTDGGQTWERLFDAEPRPTRGQILDDGSIGRALLPANSHLFTSDGFLSYFYRPLPGGEAWSQMQYASPTTGWYAGVAGGVLRTTDGGFTFQPQALPGFNPNGGGLADKLTDLLVLSVEEAYIATARPGAIDEGRIYHTTNGGATWSLLPAASDPTNHIAGFLGAVAVLPTGEIWATGGDGFIFNSGIPVPSPCGDLDGDGDVDQADLGILLAAFGACPGDPNYNVAAGELAGDPCVTQADLGVLLSVFGAPCD